MEVQLIRANVGRVASGKARHDAREHVTDQFMEVEMENCSTRIASSEESFSI